MRVLPLEAAADLNVTRVFLVDDHPVVALGLEIVLAGDPSLLLVGAARNFVRALDTLEAAVPDCLVLDLVFEGSIMLSNLAFARKALPHSAIIVYSSLPSRLYERDACAAGADAFLGKDADLSDLAALIKRVVASGTIAPAATFRHAGGPDRSTIDGVHLTRREQQVAAEIGRGLSNESIASRLALSPHTIAAHRENMRKKLDCRSSKELVARLAALSLVRFDGL